MEDRIEQELALLRRYFPQLEYRPEGRWILIPNYLVPPGTWDHELVTIACHFQPGHPGQAPYGLWIQPVIRVKATGQRPQNNYSEPAGDIPFEGTWGKFSWSPVSWRPTADLTSGDNMLNFVLSFRDRFLEGP